MNKIKYASIIASFLIGAAACAHGQTTPQENWTTVKEPDVYSLKLPADFICLEKAIQLPANTPQEELTKNGLPMTPEEFSALRKSLRDFYSNGEQNTLNYESYKKRIEQSGQKSPEYFRITLKFDPDSLVPNPFQSVPPSMLEAFGQFTEHMINKRKTEEHLKARFLPVEIYDSGSGKAVVLEYQTGTGEDGEIINNISYLFCKDKKTFSIDFEYKTTRDKEPAQRQFVNDIMKGLTLGKDYQGEVNIVDEIPVK